MLKRALSQFTSDSAKRTRTCSELGVEYGRTQPPSSCDILRDFVFTLSVPSLYPHDSDLLRALSVLLQERVDGNDDRGSFIFQVGEELGPISQFPTPLQAALLGPNPLLAAANARWEALIKLLVQYGGLDVNSTLGPDGVTLLMWACARGSADITKWLLDAKADPIARSTSDSDGA